MRVELDTFSGRPNPTWALLPNEARAVRDILRTLPRSKQAGSVKRGLGYRGLIVTETGDEHGGYDEMVVSDGSVYARSGSKLRCFEEG